MGSSHCLMVFYMCEREGVRESVPLEVVTASCDSLLKAWRILSEAAEYSLPLPPQMLIFLGGLQGISCFE